MTDMKYDFDAPVDRWGTWSEKWDQRTPGWPDALPMWVADMDFSAPPEVTAAMAERIAHGLYGYTFVPESSYEAAVSWRYARCGHRIKPEWITFSTGVVCSLKAAIAAFTAPGDSIVVQPPVYPPFFGMAAREGRRLLRSPLQQNTDGRWVMDFEGLEDCFRKGAKLMLLSSSHNPVGRIWTSDELATLAGLCIRYDVIVASDEIHCDILRPGNRHTAIASLPGMEERTITLVSTTKSFNLAGLQNSVAVTADPAMKKKLEHELYRCNHNTPNLFGMIAQEAAWTHGGPWLDQLNAYIAGNCDRALAMLAGQELIFPNRPEGTYLLWLDCRRLGMGNEELQRFFAERCRVYPTMGRDYEAEGFVRLNLATRRALVEEGIGRIFEGIKSIKSYKEPLVLQFEFQANHSESNRPSNSMNDYFKFADRLDLEGSFQIIVNGAIFFEQPEFPIMEFIYSVGKWKKRIMKTLGMDYNSIETVDNPLISFTFAKGKWKVNSKWQKYSCDIEFDRQDLENAYDSLVEQVKTQFQLV